jgi:site-specific DNA-methyltransferase (adenine-specific)
MWNVGDATVKGSETGSSFRQALYFMDECGLRLHDTMIYQKQSAAYPAGDKSVRYSQVFEYCFILSKGKPKTINLIRDKKNRWAGHSNFGTPSVRTKDGVLKQYEKFVVKEFGIRDNIWKITNSKGFAHSNSEVYKHPATMPEALAEGHILSWSNPGDLVLDPFMGSGTTARMAFKNDRNWIGFEIDKEYYDLCVKLTNFNSLFDV